MRIIVTGLVGQYAFGGVAWDYLQYVEGFRQLGHDVFYLEDTETWPYDPINNTISADCSYNVQYLGDVMQKLGLGDRWVYRNGADGKYYGASPDFCRGADVFVNVSGCGWLRDEYRAIPQKIFIDSDPLFTQVGLALGMQEVIDRIGAHDFHFTFAENINAPDCRVPKGGLRWLPTRQPVVLDWFPRATETPRDVFTTVMNWVSYKPSEYAGETWGQKDLEFRKFLDLPQHTAQKFEIAMGLGQGKQRPTELILSKGWQLIEPDKALPDPWTYRDYLANSKGEWSVAKEGYVKARSGWFSCRSACYLALGRPCVLQDTGWSAHYPTGTGLFAFATMAEAVAGIAAINADYAKHSAGARAVAAEMFDARKVLGKMLEQIG
ncbi:MAG: glycosyltransferase family 1 protein [Verrucomicrobiota bacterium]